MPYDVYSEGMMLIYDAEYSEQRAQSLLDIAKFTRSASVERVLTVGNISLDRDSRIAVQSGRKCFLANQQFRLLELLMLNAPSAVSLREINKAWNKSRPSHGQVHVVATLLRRRFGAAVIAYERGCGLYMPLEVTQ